jgi:glycerol-3-phosphate dehydrogenase
MMGRERALKEFPLLKRDGLLGALVYYDGQQDDARMNVALALTAMRFGGVMCNYVRVVGLTKDENGKINGAILKDCLKPDNDTKASLSFTIAVRGVINATGPFCDELRLMDDPKATKLVTASSGVHIVVPEYYSPRTMGLLDPATKDKRVIFFLPWQHNSLAGTTDAPSKTVNVDVEPEATKQDVDYILDELNEYLDDGVKLRRCDVISAWAGLRPLVRDPKKLDTASVVRNHLIDVSESGLLTITGGKWTTFRQMAEECIDTAVDLYNLKPAHPKSLTKKIKLLGATRYSDHLYIKLIQQFGYDTQVANHLARSYGDRAIGVALIDGENEQSKWPLSGYRRLIPYYPYIEAEVRWAVRYEQAVTPQDILCRRTRLAFHNCRAALEALPRVCQVMQEELGWSDAEKEQMLKEARKKLEKLGLPIVKSSRTESTAAQVHKLKELAKQYGPNGYLPREMAEVVLGHKLAALNHGKPLVSLADLLEAIHDDRVAID